MRHFILQTIPIVSNRPGWYAPGDSPTKHPQAVSIMQAIHFSDKWALRRIKLPAPRLFFLTTDINETMKARHYWPFAMGTRRSQHKRPVMLWCHRVVSCGANDDILQVSILDALLIVIYHYNDVIMSAMTFQSQTSRLFTQAFIQAHIKENIKAPRHWPLCREFTGDRWIPYTKCQ